MSRKRTKVRQPTSPSPAIHRPPSAKRHCTGMSILSTKNEPAHYKLKVESFSILSENPTMKIESDVFQASGYQWRLDLYPNGNKEEDEDNHISLYLVFCDTGRLAGGVKVFADVKLFAYDHIAHNYVTFQDVDGNRTRFHENQLKWGFYKLISLEHFKDDKKGYLYNDSCVFGAEVFVVPEYTQTDRCFSITKLPAPTSSYSWTVDKFSAKTFGCQNSEVFKVGKVKWSLSLYPRGHGKAQGTNLSCFIQVQEAKLPYNWRIYAKFELRVKNQSGYEDRVLEADHWFSASAVKYGFECFMPLHELLDMTKGFLLNDNLIVEAKISVIGMLKFFSEAMWFWLTFLGPHNFDCLDRALVFEV